MNETGRNGRTFKPIVGRGPRVSQPRVPFSFADSSMPSRASRHTPRSSFCSPSLNSYDVLTEQSFDGDYTAETNDDATLGEGAPTLKRSHRNYACRTFSVLNRGDELFMLDAECARELGYRDAYMLFALHPFLNAITATQSEKDDLTLKHILPYSSRSRTISLIPAQSVYREFGHPVVEDEGSKREDHSEATTQEQVIIKEDPTVKRETSATSPTATTSTSSRAVYPFETSCPGGMADSPKLENLKTIPMETLTSTMASSLQISVLKLEDIDAAGPPMALAEIIVSPTSDQVTEYDTDQTSDSSCSSDADAPSTTWADSTSDMLISALSPVKQKVAGGILNIFLRMLYHKLEDSRPSLDRSIRNWHRVIADHLDANEAQNTSDASTSTSATNNLAPSHARCSPSHKGKQKKIEDGGDNSDESDEHEDPKQPRTLLSPSLAAENKNRFACPYRKYSPWIYNSSNRQWRSCALTSFDNTSRVKHHMIYPCQRCKEVFGSQQDISLHLKQVNGCELRNIELGDGITVEMVEKLKSKKRAHRSETMEDQWQRIYMLLFPGVSIPSPYFEHPNDAAGFEEYDEYCRRELPIAVRAAVIQIVDHELQPIQEKLIEQFERIIMIAQERVCANYRSAHAKDTADSSTCNVTSSSTERAASMDPKAVLESRTDCLASLSTQIPTSSKPCLQISNSDKRRCTVSDWQPTLDFEYGERPPVSIFQPTVHKSTGSGSSGYQSVNSEYTQEGGQTVASELLREADLDMNWVPVDTHLGYDIPLNIVDEYLNAFDFDTYSLHK